MLTGDKKTNPEPSVVRASGANLRQWRAVKDRLFKHSMAIGGISVIVAILLIFFYLFYVVAPLFSPASAEKIATFPAPGGNSTLFIATEEYGEVVARITDAGHAIFFNSNDGTIISDTPLPLPPSTHISSVTTRAEGGPIGLGLSDGRALVIQFTYAISYPNNKRAIAPHIEYPLGDDLLQVDEAGAALNKLAMVVEDERVAFAAVTASNDVIFTRFTKEQSLLGENTAALERESIRLTDVPDDVRFVLLDTHQRRLYLANSAGTLSFFEVSGRNPRLVQRLSLVTTPGATLTALEFLSGSFSLMVGQSNGQIGQWFPVRDTTNGYVLTHIRDFSFQNAPIINISAEPRRKGFFAADQLGFLGIYHATAHRNLRVDKISENALLHVALAPRGDFIFAEDAVGEMHFWRVHNIHPEVSWSALWGKVWYENYQEPEYLWQSSASTNDFEPKFSLTPLSFGTLKAAFYAMLLAIPLSLLGAIFTGHFMAPRMRSYVKPTIETMEALPTVILGFLAGLWLAPFMERYLPGMVSLLLLMPTGLLLFAYAWSRLPDHVKHRIPDGYEAALMMPVVILVTWGSIAISPLLEVWLFGGDIRMWLTNEAGVSFDQRNAMVVGFAMGFAVIPNIFSIAEDAIFSVPKHISNGSLALGATPWQTLVRVVLLTASPGIFSAVMIGLGRAVGETMIVLMATGNTPVMDLSLFQGMRTLSANIAVEMPESELNSTHYRILFLAALVLFAFTFFFNSLAEIVRQRLRKKYSNL